MSVTPELVNETLNTIVDPCSLNAGVAIGLVDMGLVRDMQITRNSKEGYDVSVGVGVTEATCVLLGSFANEARERISALDGVSSVEVQVLGELNWTEADLSPDAREKLQRHRLQRRKDLGLSIARRPSARGVVVE